MSLEHAETFFHAFQNKKFLSRRDLALRASISNVSADKMVKKFLMLNLLKERKTPQAGEVGRPGRVLYVNPQKYLLTFSLAEDDCFHVFVYSLALSLHTSTSFPLNQLLTREENIVSFFRETVSFLRHYLPPKAEIVACSVLLPSRAAPKRLWDTVRVSAIENHTRRFFTDIPCYFYTEMYAGAKQALRENKSCPNTCVKITENSLHIGVAVPSPREIDLTTFSKDGQPLSEFLAKHKDLQSIVVLLGEILHNISLVLETQNFLIDHSAICYSPVFTEEVAICLKENYRRENLTLQSLSSKDATFYIRGCTDLALHNFLKFHLNGGPV